MSKAAVCIVTLIIAACCVPAYSWTRDFEKQPVAARPALEVAYTDGSRTAFRIDAESYDLTGQLTQPHKLLDPDGKPWLWMEIVTNDGRTLSTVHHTTPSRINLYRRGPYYCEVHWLDIQAADETGAVVPLRGDLALYCWPDKILASITWHAVAPMEKATLRIKGINPTTFDMDAFDEGSQQRFAFPLFGETDPLPTDALETIEGIAPLCYDDVRGCYLIGSRNDGNFQTHFYHHPNRYERAAFRIRNDDRRRTVYVCHETAAGSTGQVEAGTLLDEHGHPLPILVQLSKNFGGEKEEKFYNPNDTPFSETYFPLYLDAGQTRTVTSLHLYQNWGRHMVKQFSSLGAWMDYFHSSTGVTETTCYVPFKFGGLPGVAIADFRAMSQPTFWGSQPQHDNVAGHSFLSYESDTGWQYLTYRKTTYHSTGPNWMDITLSYLSTDSAIRADVRTFELPQADELRNFINVRYEVLRPIRLSNAGETVRLLNVATWVQQLRYNYFAASGIEDRPIDTSREHWAVRALPLPHQHAFVAIYGEPKGSNAIVLRSFRVKSKESTFGPAASLHVDKNGNLRMMIVPDRDELVLEPGDVIEFEGFWLPYGDVYSANTPRREVKHYSNDAPHVLSVARGRRVSDFPTVIEADDNQAEFTLAGGRDLIPVIIAGLSEFRRPRIYRKDEHGWTPLLHGRVGDLDGVQVFSQGSNRFGSVFLVHSDSRPQRLRVQAGRESSDPPRIRLAVSNNGDPADRQTVRVRAPWMSNDIRLLFPQSIRATQPDSADGAADALKPPASSVAIGAEWQESEADSIWFESTSDDRIIGGRLTPNEFDVDLEFWFQNRRGEPVTPHIDFSAVLAGTTFDDAELEQTWIRMDGSWRRASAFSEHVRHDGLPYRSSVGRAAGSGAPGHADDPAVDLPVMAVRSADGRHLLAMVWPRPERLAMQPDSSAIQAGPVWPECPAGRRAYRRGKLYLFEGSLTDLERVVSREILPLE